MTGLGLSGYIDWRIAMAMLIAFLLLSIETYLASYTLGIFRLSFVKFGPTEIRILLALGNLVLWCRLNIGVPRLFWRLLDFAGLIATIVMGLMVIVAALRHTTELHRQETMPCGVPPKGVKTVAEEKGHARKNIGPFDDSAFNR